MLSKEIFKKGLEEIEVAFSGFIMTKRKADIWYKYSQNIIDSEWLKKIANCIKGCSRIPTLADILDWRGYHINQKEEENLRIKRQEIEWNRTKEKNDEPIKTRSKKTKLDCYSILAKINPKYRDKLKSLERNKL